MAMVFCRGCAKEIHETAVTCPHCGYQQVAEPVAGTKSQTVATLLAACLGGLGIHRFYLGSTLLGVVYLLFCWTGIPGFIAFIEAYIYAFKSPEAWANQYNGGRIGPPVNGALKVLALIVPLIVVIGIVTAVAIPAMKRYRLSSNTVDLSKPSRLSCGSDSAPPDVFEEGFILDFLPGGDMSGVASVTNTRVAGTWTPAGRGMTYQLTSMSTATGPANPNRSVRSITHSTVIGHTKDGAKIIQLHGDDALQCIVGAT